MSKQRDEKITHRLPRHRTSYTEDFIIGIKKNCAMKMKSRDKTQKFF
jgi:hypothetical protein